MLPKHDINNIRFVGYESMRYESGLQKLYSKLIVSYVYVHMCI